VVLPVAPAELDPWDRVLLGPGAELLFKPRPGNLWVTGGLSAEVD